MCSRCRLIGFRKLTSATAKYLSARCRTKNFSDVRVIKNVG